MLSYETYYRNIVERDALIYPILRKAQAIVAQPKVTDMDRREFDRLIAQADEIEDRYQCGTPPPRDQPGGGHGGPHESSERRAFGDFIRKGAPYEHRDLTVGGAGAALIPQEFYPLLTEAQKAWGGLINIVRQRETDSGAPMKISFSNDTGSLAHVVGETGPIVENDPSLSSLLSNTDQLSTDIIKISIAELQDSAFDLDQFVRDQFGKRYYRGLTQLMTDGTSSGNIESIITGAYNGVTSLSNNSIDYDDITAMYGALDPAYIETSTWVMSSTTRALLLGIKDTFGRPLYVPSPTSGTFDRLLGQRVVLNQYMDPVLPSGGSPLVEKVPIQLGDFSAGYLLRLVKPGLAIARLNERYMDTLEVGFLGYFRAGGVATDAGTHPIVNLVMHT